MKGINQTVKLGLEILTPTQSGSGEELFKELDYIERKGLAFIVDQQASFNSVASGNLALDSKLLLGGQLSDLVNSAGQEFGYSLAWLSNGQKIPDKLREQLKDAFNRPYLPGSAIKGAIRTALIAEWLRDADRIEAISKHIAGLLPRHIPGKKPNPKLAAKNLMEELTGKCANQDIFRSFKVKDTLFTNPDLCLADIRWLNERRWRSMSKRSSFDQWQQADGIYAEVLQPGVLGLTTVQWDGFLLSDTRRWQQDGVISAIAPKDFDDLKQRLNQHAKYRLQREIQFYKEQGKSNPGQECQRLLNMMEKDSQMAYLQMSWGSGWRGMTGDWASEEQVKIIRELFNLGRSDKPFPKTRRLAVSGEPKLPLGWVRLIPYHLAADKLEKQQDQQHKIDNQSTWVNQNLARLAQQNRSTEKEALRGKALAEAWQQLPNSHEKQEALADIKRRWQAENWWEEPNGKAAKQAKTIYDQN